MSGIGVDCGMDRMQTEGSGTITVEGTVSGQSSSELNNIGVKIATGSITTATGAISITGTSTGGSGLRGVYLDESSNNTIRGNSIINNNDGINMQQYSQFNNISNNICSFDICC